jgi:hypothetical protein
VSGIAITATRTLRFDLMIVSGCPVLKHPEKERTRPGCIPSVVLRLLTAKDHPRRKGLNDENQISPASRVKCFS